jgi:hypothetical protein
MDLRTEAIRLKLDALALSLSAAFTADAIPHVLIKGPSTSLWLYHPPRIYRDVDLLIPFSAIPRATSSLISRGLCTAMGRPGEEAPHSLLLRSVEGYEVDIHFTMPTVPARDDHVWEALREHHGVLDLGLGAIPVLDLPGRCVVLALHALNNGPYDNQSLHDLRLARQQASPAVWDAARGLAERMDALDLFSAGVSLAGGPADTSSPRAKLYLLGAPPAAFGIQRFNNIQLREFPMAFLREIFPSREFMQYANPELSGSWWGLLAAHVVRWARLARQLPRALAMLRRARGGRESSQMTQPWPHDTEC